MAVDTDEGGVLGTQTGRICSGGGGAYHHSDRNHLDDWVAFSSSSF